MKDIVRLGPRLQAAANMICRAGTVLDVGCDHGKLAAALLAQGRAARVIAMDISAPSLEKARLLAARHGLEGRMETRLSDGLSAAAPGEALGRLDALIGDLPRCKALLKEPLPICI